MPNRLDHEDSPYLQQHANNPVDWYPWCDEAFEKAKRENKPIFLSIGYSSCHWCHVMEHEVFENEKIADYLNRHFVSIKVDREERPDIDKHFQAVHQLLNQRPGGWPASIFLTPDLKPFFAGTYIPPERKYNMMGFLELITVIHEKWSEAPESIVKNADEIQRYLEPKEGPIKATKLDLSLIDRTIEQANDSFDPVWGGFSKAPKFPHTSTIDLLFDLHRLSGKNEPLEMATHTLKNMAKGGIYDLVDGGFCRYSTDDMWLVPHFEKMTYDNGLLCESYLRAYQTTKDPFYLNMAEDIIDFMKEKMMENSLFYSASDADTEGEEGKYFIYTYDEIVHALRENGFDEPEAMAICKALSITPQGNFEGKNIIRNERLADYPWWPKVRRILRILRAPRTYPFIDKKVITSWNAMMIKSLFIAADIDDRHLGDAIGSMNALLELMQKGDTLYHSVLIHKTPTIEAFLEDYAYLCDALLQAYHTTLDETWLLKAQKLAEHAVDRFYENGEWYFSRNEFPTVADISDTSYPSSAAVMTKVLLTLGSLLEPRYREIAFKTMEYNSIKIVKYPLWHATFVTAALRYIKEDIVVKSLPNRLMDAKTALQDISYPYILLKPEIEPDYMVCNQHSCFANCKSMEELKEALKRF
ncbi:hypothetical protein HCR_05460 [Hydrogenimonas cancrithermarum]|uniref:Spermatogenesis-associated protein 20-like TRX domain-containing protein n=2 Tax=Hydrogenimonas cancrithermarum TaxID=2993563 RepID=A0ABN6WSW4_9BACT|nr:hypothetical protein HCR_05460 [Hydrogenimonas cancrithermarum]